MSWVQPGSRSSDHDANLPVSGLPQGRVLVLATTVPAKEGDGTPSFVLDLAEAISPRMRVNILAPRTPGAPQRATMGSVVIERFAYFPRRWEGLATGGIMPTLRAEPWRWIEVPTLILSMIVSTIRAIRRSGADVLHAHWIIPGGLAAYVAGLVTGVPYIVTVHGADIYTLRGRIAAWLKRRILRSAKALIPVSTEIREMVQTMAGDDSCVLPAVPMGVRMSDWSDVRRHDASLLVVGRLVAKKGVDVAIQAMVHLPECCLRIVGDGPELSHLQRLVDELDLRQRVHFLGQLPRTDVLDEMQRCTVLLIPSVEAPDGDKDGTPVVLAEAMSMGTVVVASNLAGLAECIEHGDTGWLVHPGDPDALAVSLVMLLENPRLCRQLGASARQSFCGGPLDLQTTAQQYVAVLTRAMNGNT